MAINTRQAMEEGPGFVMGPIPGDAEVSWLRDFVQRKWRGILTSRYPHLRAEIAATPITAYHNIAPSIDHASTFVKDTRCFTAGEVDELLHHLSAFRFLKEAFGAFEVADIEGLGHPEIYWRLVRPGHPDDVAGAHADSWFYTLTNQLPPAEQARLVKVWLPVYSEVGVSGLAFGEGSHRLNLTYAGEMRHGRMKPLLTDPRAPDLNMSTAPLHPGQCVAFHIDLLHQGVSHQTDQCRVSIEFAIRLPSDG